MKRILLALLMTLVGIGLSWRYLRPQEWTAGTEKNRPVVARVVEIRNDVNRQEEGRLLWSSIGKGDEIFLGDKIKTAGLSSIVIEFVDSTSKLEIEENSMIVMSQEGKKLALNMLEGRVFLKQEEGASGEDKLDLLSGGKKLDVKGNTAVSITQDGKSRVESFSSENLFTELKPNYSEDILTSKNTLSLAWKPLSRTEMVEVYAGESPLLLKKVEGVQADFSSGKINVPMKPGVNYWQLVSSSGGNEVKSPLMKLNLIRPLPPTPLYPAERELVKLQDRPFDYKWMKGNAGDSVILEVARDSGFSQIVLTQEIKGQTFFTPSSNLQQGEYFWRVKSRINPSEWTASEAVPFTVHSGSNLLSPTPLFPVDNSIFYVGKGMGGNVKFVWRKQENIRGYQLKIQGENFNRETQLAGTSANVNLNRVGKYTWEVYSESNDGKPSILPVKRSFEVREFGTIQWLMSQKTFLYLDSFPIIILKWDKKVPGISLLKISSSQDMSEAETFQVQGKDFPYRVLKQGLYFAKVVGVDESGQMTAESDVFEFMVQEAPLPPAPVLLGDVKKLLANPQGDLSSQISNGKPSWLTIASLVDPSGRVVDERRFTDNKLSFNGLLPGKYFLQMKFQDEYRRIGSVGERIEVEVPQKSLIAAPKIKGIKVR